MGVMDEFREFLEDLDEGQPCYYCGRALSVRAHADKALRPCRDHIISKAKGGSDDPSNIAVCCRSCNSTKGSKTVDEARHWLKLAALGWPRFTVDQLEWLRQQGFDCSTYDEFQFWFERWVEAA
jgi:hypothetical protein